MRCFRFGEEQRESSDGSSQKRGYLRVSGGVQKYKWSAMFVLKTINEYVDVANGRLMD